MALQPPTFVRFSLRGGRTTASAWIKGIIEFLDSIGFHVNAILAEGNQPLLTGSVLMLVQCFAVLHISGERHGDSRKTRDPGGLQHHQGDRLPPHRRKVLE